MKEVEDFKGYFVTKDGKVIGKRGRVLFGKITWDGYREVVLSDGARRRSVRVHILVAELYLDKVPGKTQVNHKDCNKLNNSVSNLEYTNNAENIRHAVRNGLIKTKGRAPSHLTCEELNQMFSLYREGHSLGYITDVLNLSTRPDYITEIISGRKLGDLTKEFRSETILRRSRL